MTAALRTAALALVCFLLAVALVRATTSVEPVPEPLAPRDSPASGRALLDAMRSCQVAPTAGCSLAVLPAEPDVVGSSPPPHLPRRAVAWKPPAERGVALTQDLIGGVAGRGAAVVAADRDSDRADAWSWQPPRLRHLGSAVAQLRRTVAQYPQGVVANAGIKRFLFVDNLRLDGVRFAGAAVLSTGTVVLSTAGRPDRLDGTIHHEILRFPSGCGLSPRCSTSCRRTIPSWRARPTS